MTIQVVCSCGKKLQVKDEMAGKRGKCPACGNAIAIPAASAATGASKGAATGAAASAGPDLFGTSGGGFDLGSLGGFENSGGPLGAGGNGAGNDPLGATLPASTPLAGAPTLVGGAGAYGGGMAAGQGYGKPAAKPTASASKPLLSRWYVWAGAGGALLAIIAVVTVVAFFAFSGNGGTPVANNPVKPPVMPGSTPSPTPTPGAVAPAPAAQPLPLKVQAASEFSLAPGETAFFDVAIDRAGVVGPVQVQVEGLSAKVGTAPVEIAEGQSAAKVVLLAAADAVEESQSVKVVVLSGGARVEHPLALTVKKVVLPTLTPISAVSLAPGGSAVASVNVARNGHEGPIQIQVTGLPANVVVKPLEIAAGQSAGNLEISAAPDAAVGSVPARLVASVGGRSAETQFQIAIAKVSFKILQMPVVWLAPQEKTTLEVRIERGGFQGPIELTAEGLPDNVTVSPTSVPAGQSAVKIEIAAGAEAKDKVRSGRLVGSAGGATAQKFLIVRVKTAEGSLLPEVGINPEMRNLLKRGSFGGRLTTEGKQMLRDIFGGTSESETAILAGLKWLDKHQADDGHWSLEAYNTLAAGCDCEVAMEDKVTTNNTGATALGVLPFLGVGITPDGAPETSRDFKKYQKTVKSALAYLVKNQTATEGDEQGNLGGGMYGHALGTIALCEAYALTNDKDLKVPAQRAVRYLLEAQHVPSGGWGYGRKQPGDTSIVGWVFLGIRSGQMAGMAIEPRVLAAAGKFLDSTSSGPEGYKKSRYSYKPGTDPTVALSAAGLLSRQYLGWQTNQPELPEGCKFIMQTLPPEAADKVGPSYYYYYATQVLHHMEGKDWDLWNHFMREHLVRTQEKSGHKQGSWSPEGSDWGSAGGRIYSTSLSLLTLEVYYRHLPLYRKIPKATE